MKVKAIKLGYYKHKRRKEGEVFYLEDIKVKSRGKDKKVFVVPAKDQFTETWMELLDANARPPSDEDEEPAVLEEPSADKVVNASKAGRSKASSPGATA